MNLPIFTRGNRSTSLYVIAIATVLLTAGSAFASWKIDFAHRVGPTESSVTSTDLSLLPAQAQTAAQPNLFSNIIDTTRPVQDIVILNTDKGFIPSTIRVREGQQYRIYVVNVNKNDRNVSFIMDAFNEYDSTYYGKVRSFNIAPTRDGVYSYESPETSAQGQLIVYSTAPAAPVTTPAIKLDLREPASE